MKKLNKTGSRLSEYEEGLIALSIGGMATRQFIQFRCLYSLFKLLVHELRTHYAYTCMYTAHVIFIRFFRGTENIQII